MVNLSEELMVECPLRIGFLTTEYPTAHSGGIGSYVREMAHTLADLGHSVCVLLCAQSPEGLMWDGPVPIYTIGIPEDISHLPSPLGKRSGLIFARRLAELAKKHRLDVLEAPEYLGLTAFLSMFKPSGLSVIVRLHTSNAICRYLNGYRSVSARSRRKDGLQDWLERRAIQTADSVTAISNATVIMTSKMLRLRRDDLLVTPNPINDRFFSLATNDPGSTPLVLFAGRLEWRKGPDLLIRAVPAILERHPEARFCFVGGDTNSGPCETSMHAYLSSLVPRQVGERVEFAGSVKPEQLLRKYQESTICVFPSRWEGFGLVAAEAMACGKPVVVSDTPGFREIISEKVTGLFAKSEDTRSLAATINLLLSDSRLQQALGTAAREAAVKRFRAAAVGKSMLSIYRKVIAGRANEARTGM